MCAKGAPNRSAAEGEFPTICNLFYPEKGTSTSPPDMARLEPSASPSHLLESESERDPRYPTENRGLQQALLGWETNDLQMVRPFDHPLVFALSEQNWELVPWEELDPVVGLRGATQRIPRRPQSPEALQKVP